MENLTPTLLSTLWVIERYACLIRAAYLDVNLREQMSPPEYRDMMRFYVKQFNFYVEKFYEQDTLFLIRDL